MVNTSIRISKRVKSETQLSRGSASLAFAASSYIRSWLGEEQEKKILLIGAGDIGKATCGNLLKHIPARQLMLINRSQARAQELASRYQIKTRPWSLLTESIREASIVIVATSATHPIIHPEMIHQSKQQLFLDLSMPRNISPALKDLKNIRLLDLDELVEQTKEVIHQRRQEIPPCRADLGRRGRSLFSLAEGTKVCPTTQRAEAKNCFCFIKKNWKVSGKNTRT